VFELQSPMLIPMLTDY